MKKGVKNLRKVEFFNRESEAEEITNILKTEPRLVNFIYGPINSGKTALIMNIIENLPPDYVVFYVNLRGKFITSYNDFVESLFEIDKESKKKKSRVSEFTKEFLEGTGKYYGIPIPENLLNVVFKDNEPKNVFEYITKVMKEIKKNNRQPILIIDELQVIGDLKIDEYLIYKLFNFFIRLTKELHLCHVFALSSDSLFIEKVYSEAMLQGRAKYLFVDDFDPDTAKRFLGYYKFGRDEIDTTLRYLGGKPSHLVELIDAKRNKKDLKSEAIAIVKRRKIEINQKLYVIRDIGKEVEFEGKTIPVDYAKILNTLKLFVNKDCITYSNITPEIMYLVTENLLFVDSSTADLKPQSRTDLIAIRESLKELPQTS